MLANELLDYIFDDPSHVLATKFGEWVTESSRFKVFAETYRDKIRKKLRNIRDEEGYKDLQCEIETAYRLLQEKRFAVEYEKYGVGGQRGPDLSVTFRTRLVFNVEVKRLRGVGQEQQAEKSTKITNAICDKLLQMPPSVINLLALVADGDIYAQSAITEAVKRLKERAERKDVEFFLHRGYQTPRDFLQSYRRLSGILLRNMDALGMSQPATLWMNPEAKHVVPSDLRNALLK
jgi:hypothetical protein